MWRRSFRIALCEWVNSHRSHSTAPASQQRLLFRQILQSLQTNANTCPSSTPESAAAVSDGPLTSRTSLLERLGVLELHVSSPNETPSLLTSASAVTEACRAGIAGGHSPLHVLRALREAFHGETVSSQSTLSCRIPPEAAAILLSAATARLSARASHSNGPFLGAAVAVETQRAKQLLHEVRAMMDRTGSGEAVGQRARLGLAVVLGDACVARGAGEAMATAGGVSVEDVLGAVRVVAAVDFGAGRALGEKLTGSLMKPPHQQSHTPNQCNDGTPHADERRDGLLHGDVCLRLRLLTTLADAVGAEVSAFLSIREELTVLFADTEAGYAAETREAARGAVCALFHALARCAMDPREKMSVARDVFRSLQRTAHVSVCAGHLVLEALLRVASAARDGPVALHLYNQLHAPKYGRGWDVWNVAAVLLAESDAAGGLARLFAMIRWPPSAGWEASPAVQLVAVRLLRQKRPSNEVYVALDCMDAARDRFPQCTLFIRLLVLARDVGGIVGGHGVSHSDEQIASHTFNAVYACEVVSSWCEALTAKGIRTASITSLMLLQRLRTRLAAMCGMETLVERIDAILVEMSFGWLRHRAWPERTPKFYLRADELQRRLSIAQERQTPILAWRRASASHLSSLSSMPHPETKEGLCDFKDRVTFLRDVNLGGEEELEKTTTTSDVQSIYATLTRAAKDGVFVVLGLSDYAHVCRAEDRSLLGHSSYFALDQLNTLEPPVYVTDALGEICLHASKSVTGVTLEETRKMETLEDWICMWLDETRTVLPSRDAFHEFLEQILREECTPRETSVTDVRRAFVEVHEDGE